jgi:hypothetical protein
MLSLSVVLVAYVWIIVATIPLLFCSRKEQQHDENTSRIPPAKLPVKESAPINTPASNVAPKDDNLLDRTQVSSPQIAQFN